MPWRSTSCSPSWWPLYSQMGLISNGHRGLYPVSMLWVGLSCPTLRLCCTQSVLTCQTVSSVGRLGPFNQITNNPGGGLLVPYCTYSLSAPSLSRLARLSTVVPALPWKPSLAFCWRGAQRSPSQCVNVADHRCAHLTAWCQPSEGLDLTTLLIKSTLKATGELATHNLLLFMFVCVQGGWCFFVFQLG